MAQRDGTNDKSARPSGTRPGHPLRGDHHLAAPERHAYIPCLGLLDFLLPPGAVELIAYAHSIDFGTKGYANLDELASLQDHVVGEFGRPVGLLLMTVKSACLYQTELPYMQGVLGDQDSGSPR